MAYAKKTCNICGYIDIQPHMVRKAKRVQIATSIKGLTGRDIAGMFLGSKESVKSVRNWLYSPNKRIYSRKRMVWMCEECADSQTDFKSGVVEKIRSGVISTFFKGVCLMLVVLILFGIFAGAK